MLSFTELCDQYNLPHATFFFYLQMRSVLKELGAPLQSNLSQLPIEKALFSSPKQGGHVTRLYNTLLIGSHQPLALDSAWKADFNNLSPELDWSTGKY